ncbi:retron system putative HNH endonuclease [Ectothiorhodospira sp. BSL-9]|uniref:retron system putative HNH endonuclease n=1 Tax=Ectothiorhodospira sp. BSL-9 TaxID=1442136 RepID=UPI0007B44E3E|nr:retron system putative HNH endonuclease [Ectothiorhodospira sp. BSL-9]ANB01736.1 hypothetical protein ECTOBSL9_0912 [Ectothiorhodospira sp. BSL-9]
MKHVKKRQEPEAFTQWKALANEDWQPTYDDLIGEPKAAVKGALMQEQGYLCCYCERRLTEADSHIEHFQPQRDPAVDPLDYSNLLCSCQNQIRKGEPRHCGNLKGDWFDPELLISPLDPYCENRFAFEGDGLIKPADINDHAASETINRLGLDIPKLNDLRASVIDPFLEDSLTQDELRRFVSGYLKVGDDGRFAEFWTTIKYLFGDLAAA